MGTTKIVTPGSQVVPDRDTARQVDSQELKFTQPTFLTFIPVVVSFLACLFRSSVTVAIGFNPAFSASV